MSAKNDVLECGTSLAEYEHRTDKFSASTWGETHYDSIDALRSSIAFDIVRDGDLLSTFASPFQVPSNVTNPSGKRFLDVPLVYCDQTASNRPLRSVERYIERVCLPLYGNTHTNTSITGSQSTAFVAEARQIVAEETNAKISGKASRDVVLFAGNGATSAVELLIDCLGLSHASRGLSTRPVMFIGPYEHHSNLIPWRESGCEVVMVPECPQAKTVDFDALQRLLQKSEYSGRMKIGTFSAASNVTGKISDVDRIAAVLHENGALAFFDYATAAPYVCIDMNPPPSEKYPSPSMTAKDAIFLSPHKMIGGVGTPGILIIKKHLISQVNAPHRSGGGSVFYVTNTHHRFLSNRIERYEAGTPNVTGIIRVGLAFLLKRQVELSYNQLAKQDPSLARSMEDLECTEYSRVNAYLREHAPNLVLLGSDDGGRNLPIFSFLIRFGERFLHYNYVCALLNDVFGIQSRGGCQCSGPYSQKLLGLTHKGDDGNEVPNLLNEEIEAALVKYKEHAELLRPGYTRLSLPFKGLHSVEVDYILHALVWIAKNGWILLCQYRCNHKTGEWRHASRQGKPLGKDDRKWLSHFDFSARNVARNLSTEVSADLVQTLERASANADALLDSAVRDQRSIIQALKMKDAELILGKDDDIKLEKLRWYVYPKEAASYLSTSANGFISESVANMTSNNSILGALNPFCSHDKFGKSTWDRKRNRDSDSPTLVTNYSTFREKLVVNENSKMTKTEASFASDEKYKKAPRGSNVWGTGDLVPIPSIAMASAALKSTTAENTAVASSSPLRGPGSKRFKHVKPPPKLMRLVTQAMIQWNMIQEGDRLLLGLSGGKDSLSLLHCLLEFRRKHPVKFDLQICTIDPLTPSFDPSPLIPYVESLGLTYHYIRDDIVSRANSAGKDGKMVSSLCAFCARMKRGNLYACARKNNCNKLVLAQHLDDCAESFFMSVMHNGFLRTMKANYTINAGDMSVIRPLVYCRESLMTEFAKSANLPVINENCPACFEEPKERARVKKLLSREEALYPNFYDNIKRSLLPLMHDDATAILRCYTEDVVSKSRKKVYAGEISDSERLQNKKMTHRILDGVADEDLVKELARRKAAAFRLSGAMKRLEDDADANHDLPADPTGQFCSLYGGDGMIPCSELME